MGGSWPLLDEAGRNGVLVAALIALPLQVVAFAALSAGRTRTTRFLAAWVAGTLARMIAVFAGAFVVVWAGLPAAPALLALAGFFLGMLLLEPVFLTRSQQAAESR
jgi:hypothetical protein